MFHIMPSWSSVPSPALFTYPFAYVPDALSVEAAAAVRRMVETNAQWMDEAASGKMFGVLVAEDASGSKGFLAAFSGTLGGSLRQEGFVPPVYDYEEPTGHFKVEEGSISEMNRRISELENSPERRKAQENLRQELARAKSEVEQARQAAEVSRRARAERRASNPEQAADFDRQSQHEKAELKRLKRRCAESVAKAEEELRRVEAGIAQLKEQRRMRSEALQEWLFGQMSLVNILGERKTVLQLFREQLKGVPPSGTGDCCAPKLLQYAFACGLRPLSMAEFWYGVSPRGVVRHDGLFYPACHSKCAPLLPFLLRGVRLMPNPLIAKDNADIEIVYEDDVLLVACKPAGLLTASSDPGEDSLLRRVRLHCPTMTGPGYVHRLDMSTSGLVVFAKDKATHAALQAQFEGRTVRKRYVAVVEGRPKLSSGTVDLPLCLDPDDRPRQMVSPEYGKPAVTRFEVLDTDGVRTRLALYPLTGRTHQLRVHASHPLGLATPIVGDNLYGSFAERMLLHAEMIEFDHPLTGERIKVERKADF